MKSEANVHPNQEQLYEFKQLPEALLQKITRVESFKIMLFTPRIFTHSHLCRQQTAETNLDGLYFLHQNILKVSFHIIHNGTSIFLNDRQSKRIVLLKAKNRQETKLTRQATGKS